MVKPLENWTPANAMLAICLGAIVTFIVFLASEQKKDLEFRSYGGRFSRDDAEKLSIRNQVYTDSHIENLEREDRRLQCQIDRLEGRKCILDGLKFETPWPIGDREMIAQQY